MKKNQIDTTVRATQSLQAWGFTRTVDQQKIDELFRYKGEGIKSDNN